MTVGDFAKAFATFKLNRLSLVGVTVRLMSDGELGRLKVLRGFGSAAAD
jgi:hypothetical protein